MKTIYDEEFCRDTFDALLDVYNGNDTIEFINDEQLVRTNPVLPSEKASDYKTIAVDIGVNNRSFFKLMKFSAIIDNADEDSRVLYTYGSEVTETAGALKGSSVNVMWMEIYCGDLTEEELLEYIRGLDIIVYYDSTIAGVRQKKVSLDGAVYRE